MVVSVACSRSGITMGEIGGLAPTAHSRGEIDQIDMLDVLLGTGGDNKDNRRYIDEESDNPDYYWGHEEGRSLLEENGGIIPPIELEDEAIDGRRTDSDVDAYLANSRVPNEYRDAKTYYRS